MAIFEEFSCIINSKQIWEKRQLFPRLHQGVCSRNVNNRTPRKFILENSTLGSSPDQPQLEVGDNLTY